MRKSSIVMLLVTFYFIQIISSTKVNHLQVIHNSLINNTTQIIWVPDNYTSIQSAINVANFGDKIIVKAGKYSESILVNKTLELVGDSNNSAIIDGKGEQFALKVKASNTTISGFTLQHSYTAIWLDWSENCRIIDNNIVNCSYGIRVENSENATIKNNNISDSRWFGLELDCSGNSTLRNNRLSGEYYNFRVDGKELFDFINDIDSSNTVNGLPVHYLINQRNRVLNTSNLSEVGYLALINSSDVTVKDLSLKTNGQGILVAHSYNVTLTNLRATQNFNGIEIKSSSNITITGNQVSNNFDYGIKLRDSQNCVIKKNSAYSNSWGGISLFTSQNSVVSDNNVSNSYYGFHIVYSDKITVTRNTVTNTNGYSVVLYYSNFNFIHHNNFVNYFIYRYVPITNRWDDYFEGNYWTSYQGNDTDYDGIGDTPYIFEENNQDNNPLMGRFIAFEIAPGSYITTISNSTSLNLKFTQSTKTIHLTVKGPNNTKGFCRIKIPKEFNNNTYTVLVNEANPLKLEELTHPNSEDTHLYILYTHSHSQIPSNPPYPLHLFALAALVVGTVVILGYILYSAFRHRKRPKENDDKDLKSPQETMLLTITKKSQNALQS